VFSLDINATTGVALAEIAGLGAAGQRAASRTVRKVTRWASGRIARDIARSSRVPLRALTKGGSTGRGKRIRARLPRQGEMSGSVWVGWSPIKATYVGRLSQNRRPGGGARAGQHRFPGSFVATMRSGHRGVFTRSVESRLPIEEEGVELLEAEAAVRRAKDEMGLRIQNVLRQELNYELNVKGHR